MDVFNSVGFYLFAVPVLLWVGGWAVHIVWSVLDDRSMERKLLKWRVEHPQASKNDFPDFYVAWCKKHGLPLKMPYDPTTSDNSMYGPGRDWANW